MKGIAGKLAFAGVLAPIWIVVGVFIAALFYPGYSHVNQALSELGAVGSPTQHLSPAINNFPLSVQFIAFGIAVCLAFRTSAAAVASGVLIAAHGIGTFVAGYFSCDPGCAMDSPSTSQIVHVSAGFIMFLSLTIANFIWAKIGNRVLNLRWFNQFSLACAVLSLVLIVLLVKVGESKIGYGLYQRLNYGFSLIWLFVLGVKTINFCASSGDERSR
jgi:hypothetical membrane protein